MEAAITPNVFDYFKFVLNTSNPLQVPISLLTEYCEMLLLTFEYNAIFQIGKSTAHTYEFSIKSISNEYSPTIPLSVLGQILLEIKSYVNCSHLNCNKHVIDILYINFLPITNHIMIFHTVLFQINRFLEYLELNNSPPILSNKNDRIRIVMLH